MNGKVVQLENRTNARGEYVVLHVNNGQDYNLKYVVFPSSDLYTTVTGLKAGDSVDFSARKDDNDRWNLAAINKAQAGATTKTNTVRGNTFKRSGFSGGKSPEESKRIVRQNTLNRGLDLAIATAAKGEAPMAIMQRAFTYADIAYDYVMGALDIPAAPRSEQTVPEEAVTT